MASDSSRKLDSIEALRGIAACLVVAFHATRICEAPHSYGRAPFAGFWHFGQAGVDVFFVLSGFIIAHVHWGDIGQQVRFPSFAIKRLLRIYPAYWTATALLGTLLALSPTQARLERDPVHVLSSLLLIPTSAAPVLDVAWSLRHEMLFYAVFGCAILSRRWGLGLLVGWAVALVVSAALRIASSMPAIDSAALSLLLSTFNIDFLFGIGVALSVRAKLRWRPSLVATAGFMCFGANAAFRWSVVDWRAYETPQILAYGIGSALILQGLATLDVSGRIRTPTALVRLGAASYSIYLTHVPVILVAEYALRPVRKWIPVPAEVTLVVLVAVAIAAGMAFSRVVERPALRFGRELASRLAVPRLTVPSA